MMAAVGPPSSTGFLPLLESLEDSTAGQSEQTDAYLTIANRLSGEEGRQFLPAVEKHFSRLGKAILAHISSPNAELSQAALQALGFCVYHSHVVSGVSETFTAEILSALCSLVVKSTEKNTCTRALWVISKQSFPPDVVAKKAASILGTLESVCTKEDIQSVVLQHEALNVIIRLLEQVPTQMGDGAVQWAKLVVPLVVHSASKVRLRAAAAMEMGLPLLLQKQKEVAAIIEPMMSTKLIPELQKLFTSKNEANVLKLWPLFVKLLGKLLHRGGPFINSLLHLEELGFRSSSPTVKKIAFIAWKSLIDNFALNPDILCSAKRMKLLMQPLMSINVRTEALLLTKVEVWWYLVIQLGPNVSTHFDLVSVPLLQYTIGSDSTSLPGTPARAITQNGASTPVATKSASAGFNSPANTSRMSLNSSVQAQATFPSIQLLGLEMLLHYFLGPEVVATASKSKVNLSLEPLKHPLTSGASSFTKHAAVLISNMKDGFVSVGKAAPESLLSLLWKNLVHFVNVTIESGSIKKDRQGCEVLTLMLQALESIITSEALPADRVLVLFECTVKGISHRVLGSASYQVGKMDVLNGTPALFLILLLYNSSMLASYIEDERFYQCLQTLVDCGLSGPTSPLAFAEAVLGAIGRSATSVQNKEQLWRMWSVVVGPLTDTITQSNEVNQGDALEHNFSAVHTALLFPINHLLHDVPLQQASQKSMLLTWSKLYKVFARCSALVVTAEENICCEELCAKMATTLNRETLMVPSTLNAVASILQVMVECVDFSPYTPQFQQKLKSPHTPVNWMRKRNKALGNLSTLQSLLLQCLDLYLEDAQASSEATGIALVSVLSALFTNLVLPNAVKETLASVIQSLSVLYKQAASEQPKFTTQILTKLEKLLSDILGCLQSRSTLAYDDELLALLSPLLCVLFPHKIKPLRTSMTHFWNSTFAKSVRLSYPEELRPVLSQVKQNTPIILPGFEVVSVSDELSAQYSSESSQLETKLSGMPVSSMGKRDSLQAKTPDPKDKSTAKTAKPVSTKLDFGSPKPPRREALEEEASIDFVFIPPETKERVLTEHQKEMKRTKRVDIPAMYNNLDASLDTTVFSQYTQSQEDSMGKQPTEQADEVAKEASGKASQEEVAMEEEPQETQDYASPETVQDTADKEDQTLPKAVDISMEDDANSDVGAADVDMPANEGNSPNISGCSDLVSGTPQKSSSSRRQSFITLEKYAEGKPASPIAVSSFTGPLAKTSSSQELGNDSTPSPQAMQKASSQNSDNCSSSKTITSNAQHAGNNALESPHRPKESRRNKCEPVKLTDRMHSESSQDEDMIPDTQSGVEVKDNTALTPTLGAVDPSRLEEQSQQTLDDSQSSVTEVSPGEPRRSGRSRAKSQLPGEGPEGEGKNTQSKRRRSEGNKSDSQTMSTPQSRPNTRSKLAIEEENSKVRTRAQRDKSESSQSNSQGRSHRKTKLYNSSADFLDSTEPKRRSSRSLELSQSDLQSDSQSDYDSQSQGRRRGRPRASVNKEEVAELKREVLSEKRLSQTATPDLVVQTEKNETEVKASSQIVAGSSQTDGQSCTGELVGQTEKDANETKTDSQNTSASLQKNDQSQFDRRTDTDKSEPKIDYPMATATPKAPHQSQLDGQTETDKSEPKIDTPVASVSPLVSDQYRASEPEDNLINENADSQVIVSSPANESQGRTNTSQMMPETEDPASVEQKTMEEAGDNIRQEGSQVMTPESSGSQPLRRGRRSKALSEAAEDKNESQDTPRRQSRSSSQANLTPASQVEAGSGGRTRRSKAQEGQSKQSPSSTPENSQSLESTESSQGRGRYSKRRSSQMLVASMESSESESSETREESSKPKKRGRPSRTQPLKSPLAIESQDRIVNDSPKDDSDIVEKEDLQRKKANVEDSEDSQKQDLEGSQPLQITGNTEEQKEEQMDAEVDAVASQPVVVETTETEVTNDSETPSASPDENGCRGESPKITPEYQPSQESGTEEVESSEKIEPVSHSDEQIQETLPCDTSSLVPSDDAAETLQSPEEALQEKAADTVESGDEVTVSGKEPDAQNDSVFLIDEPVQEDCDVPPQEDCDVPPQEESVPAVEEPQSPTLEQNQSETPNVVDELLKDKNQSANEPSEESAGEELATVEESDKDEEMKDCQDEEHIPTINTENDLGTHLDAAAAAASDACTASEPTTNSVFQDSPAKQKDLEAAMVPDVVQSPSSGRTRGTWSPSASPSTSILKKGQKRCLEEETPSPLVKSRRVSFANPIQQQELADDIDRRSPALRTSSPRRSRISSIPQPKFITTPTKGLLVLSPRNLHSPGHKSSKKCLISEMSQEPRPLSKDCIYPALVGCSAPVEAVLPQISSNMWSRGFGQLVRARNIKTVGDLSALTPTKVKALPIRSPKLSNVKKALRLYEQQRKGRGVEELKSFDETEMLTSELEDTSVVPNHEEGDKASVETLATELEDEPFPADGQAEQNGPAHETHDTTAGQRQPEEAAHPEGLLSEVEALGSRLTPPGLGFCSPQQLVHMHDQLGGMMRRVVVELQTRLGQTHGKP